MFFGSAPQIPTVSVLPSPGVAGRIVRLSGDGSVNFDNGTAWQKFTLEPPATNYALATNGATVTATSVLSSTYAAAFAIDGIRVASPRWDAGGIFHSNDAASSGAPQDLIVTFPQSQTINKINVVTVRDSFTDTSPVTLLETFTLYGIIDFTLDYWNGSSYVNIETVTGNNKVWRQFAFAGVATTKIRLRVTSAGSGNVRLAELEAIG